MNKDEETLLKQISAILETLSDDSRKFLETIDLRMSKLYEHKQASRQISGLLLLCKIEFDEATRNTILDFISQIKSNIIPAFAALHPELIPAAERKLEEAMQSELHDIEQLQRELEEEITAPAAKSKIESIVKALKEELKAHEAKEDIVKHLEKCIDTIDPMLQKEKSVLQQEIRLITRTENAMQKQMLLTEYDSLSFEWKTLDEDLDRILRAEKVEIIDHIRPLFKDERKVSRLVERLLAPFAWIKQKKMPTPEEIQAVIAGEKITTEDIVKDISTFTNPGETAQYLTQLRKNIDLLDERARQAIFSTSPMQALGFSLMSPEAKRLAELSGTTAGRVAEKKINIFKGLAEKDELTGLYRRNAFETILQKTMERAQKDPEKTIKFALLFIDIDRFKLFNDTYTHIVGDIVLKYAAQKLQSLVRDTEGDAVCRWGGEEIIILLQKMPDKAEAVEKAEQIRTALEVDSFEELKTIHREAVKEPGRFGFTNEIAQRIQPLTTVRYPEDADILIQQIHKDFPKEFGRPPPDERRLRKNITISIGVAVYPDDAKTISGLVAIADKRLQKAKEKGRNRAEAN